MAFSRSAAMAYSRSSLSEVSRSWLVFSACSKESLVNLCVQLLGDKTGSLHRLMPNAATVAKEMIMYALPVFARENLGQCARLSYRLQKSGISTMLDHSQEEATGPEVVSRNKAAKVALIRDGRRELGDALSFVPIKMSALCNPELLEQVSDTLIGGGAAGGELDSVLKTLDDLCKLAATTGVGLLLDAEETYRQPAVRAIWRELAARHNPLGAPATVYQTYQMYLREQPRILKEDLDAARAGKYVLGAKIVRGAYLATEARRAAARGEPSPCCDAKSDTDMNYDNAVSDLLRSGGAHANVMIATHNANSVELAVRELHEIAAAEDSGGDARPAEVHFAQILGIGDSLTYALASEGFAAHKLVPFGEIDELMPWPVTRI